MNELFREPWWVYGGALAIGALAALWPASEARRRRVLALFGELGLIEPMIPAQVASTRLWKTVLRLGALFFLLAALAGPRWGVEILEGDETGIHAVIAVDVSGSMLSEDLKPNRLDKAKRALTSFIDDMAGNRVGIVAFSGMAAVQCPLTTDTNAARLFLHAVRPDMLPVKGTAVGEAIALATRMLAPYPGTKGLVLITDGEDHGSDPVGAAKAAADAGIRIFTLGMGKPDGEPIPLRDTAGKITGYKKDEKGNTVLSKLDEKTLMEVARVTGGAYFRTTASEAEITDITDQLKHLDRSRLSSGIRERFQDRTHLPLLLVLLLLLVELALPIRAPAAKPLPADQKTPTPTL